MTDMYICSFNIFFIVNMLFRLINQWDHGEGSEKRGTRKTTCGNLEAGVKLSRGVARGRSWGDQLESDRHKAHFDRVFDQLAGDFRLSQLEVNPSAGRVHRVPGLLMR